MRISDWSSDVCSSDLTYVNWQFRAELQALRHRLHGDQRCAGRRHVPAPLSFDALQAEGAEHWLADPAAEIETAQGAADNLAALLADRLDRESTRLNPRH